uniref:Glycosylphosphatidylinositol anchor attachment 1 protein n=1 Tax=Paramoeba aestuarina TaxID=180227 RepID=A0A7S4P557_9EUKA
MSEHALLPGQTVSSFSLKDAGWAAAKEKELAKKMIWMEGEEFRGEDREEERVKFVEEVMEEVGLERSSYYLGEGEKGSPLAVGVLRGKRGYGTEAIVLVTPFEFMSKGEIEEKRVGGKDKQVTNEFFFVMSVLKGLVTANWLNKDIVLIVPDTHNERFLLSLFFSSYHSLTHSFPPSLLIPFPSRNYTSQNVGTEKGGYASLFLERLKGRRRGREEKRGLLPFVGRLRTGLRVEIKTEADKDYLLYQNVDGRLPNLDLVNTMNRIAGKERLYFSYPKHLHLPLLDTPTHPPVSAFVHSLSQLPQTLGLKTNPPLIETYVWEMLKQGFGSPSSPHFVFSEWRVEGLGLTLRGGKDKNMVKYGKLLEGFIRCANNLIETLHQSFYQYILPDISHYTSIGQYMISFGVIALPLALTLICAVYVVYIPNSVSGPLWVQIVLYELCGVSVLYLLPVFYEEGGVLTVVVASFFLFSVSFCLSPSLSSLFFPLPPEISKENEFFAYKWTGLTFSCILLGAVCILNFSQSVWWASLLVLHACLPSLSSPNSRIRQLLLGLFLLLLSPPSLLLLFSFLVGVEEVSFLQSLLLDRLHHSTLLLPSFFTIYLPFHVHCWRYFMTSFSSQKQ